MTVQNFEDRVSEKKKKKRKEPPLFAYNSVI